MTVCYIDIPGVGPVRWDHLIPTGDEGDDPALLRMHLEDCRQEITRLRRQVDELGRQLAQARTRTISHAGWQG